MINKVFIRERSYFDATSFARKINADEEKALRVLKSLCSKNVVRFRAPDDFDEYDTEEDKGRSSNYQFKFVGLVIVEDLVLLAFPKYMDFEPSLPQLRLILKVIRKRIGAYTYFPQYSYDGMIGDSKLSLMLELLETYLEYGEYSNFIDAFRQNGFGEISWDRTISHYLPAISNGRPVYVDYQTRKIERDESDLITRIHRGILTECSSQLNACGILDLFDIEDLPLSHESIEAIGDAEVLIRVLENEKSKQYVSWKQHVLSLMTSYLKAEECHQDKVQIQCLGTSSFHIDWEKACKFCLGDMLPCALGSLNITLSEKWKRRSGETLLEIIPTPEWTVVSLTGEEEPCDKTQTFIPDLITLSEDGSTLCIFDAKYYTPKLSAGHKPKGQPGIESVAKQFLYQEAYKTFAVDNGLTSVLNAFLMPTCSDNARMVARVSFSHIFSNIEAPLSKYIDVWELPAEKVFAGYLENRRLDFGFCHGSNAKQ